MLSTHRMISVPSRITPKLITKLTALLLLSISSNLMLGQTVLRVNSNTPCTTGCDGTSWALAFDHVQDALDVAVTGQAIWVAAGTYVPATNPPGINLAGLLDKTFHLVNGIKLYGGFAGTETSLSQRDVDANETILSGDLGGGNRARHVVLSVSDNNTTELNGFTIRDGETGDPNSGPGYQELEGIGIISYAGAGVYSTNSGLKVIDCIFISNNSNAAGVANAGGAFYCEDSPGTTVLNCEFRENIGTVIRTRENASTDIGFTKFIGNEAEVIYATNAGLEIYNCEFRNNDAGFRGMVFNNGGGMFINNSLFAGNECSNQGVIQNHCSGCTATIIGTTISSNKTFSDSSGAIGNRGVLTVKNSILWGNTSTPLPQHEIYNYAGASTNVSHSTYDDGTPGNGTIDFTPGTNNIAGNIDLDPLFVLPIPSIPSDSGDLHLTLLSPAIDAGDNTVASNVDLDGNPRTIGSAVDMGSYEYDPCAGIENYYVDSSATGANDGTSWVDAFTSLQSALDLACPVDTVFVAKGTYFPSAYPSGCIDCVSDRDFTFHLPNGIVLMGGYPTGGGAQDIENNRTILSGNIGDTSIISDNVYHVLLSVHDDSTTLIDGFQIVGGALDETWPFPQVEGELIAAFTGGGIQILDSDVGIRNCTFRNNKTNYPNGHGGGIHMTSSNSRISNCVFEQNGDRSLHVDVSTIVIEGCLFIDNDDGAIFSDNSEMEMSNSILQGNSAYSSPALFLYQSTDSALSVRIYNSLFTNNISNGSAATGDGGAIRTSRLGTATGTQQLNLYNCTFSGNRTKRQGAAMYVGPYTDAFAYNCIFWGDSAEVGGLEIAGYPNSVSLSHCVYDDGSPGDGSMTLPSSVIDLGGNQDLDPLFVQPVALAPTIGGNYRLLPFSPAINAGENAVNPTSTDLDDSPRRQESVIDIGAYEMIQCTEVAKKIHIDQSANGNNTGQNWSDALTSLEIASRLACPGDSILIAQGTYFPSAHPLGCTNCINSRDNTFQLPPGINLFGGFPAGGGGFAQRNPELFPTILDGGNNTMTNNDDNRHVVLIAGPASTSTSIVNGLTIQEGKSSTSGNISLPDCSIPNDEGAGIFVCTGNLLVENCILKEITSPGDHGTIGISGGDSITCINTLFKHNNGRALDVNGVQLNLQECAFRKNYANASGGAISILNGNTSIIDCVFDSNYVTGGAHGGALEVSGPVIIDRSIFEENSSGNRGGAIYAKDGDLEMYNSLLFNNSADVGGAVHFTSNNVLKLTNVTMTANSGTSDGDGLYLRGSGTINISNSILHHPGEEINTSGGGGGGGGSFSGTLNISFSLIDNSYGGTGNIDTVPLFTDSLNGDFSLLLNSPCINTGINDSLNTLYPLDLPGNPRPYLGAVDMGAFEYYDFCTHPDYATLDSLFNKLDGDNWTNKTGWLTDCDPCNWHGILCDADNRVISLDLQVNNLSGTLPPEISELTYLRNIWLGVNQITGGIPVEIAMMPHLQNLWLHFNNLTDTIPAELGNSPNLRRIYLYNNPNLHGLIPGSLGNISTLEVLRIHSTGISGCYDANLANLCTQLGFISGNADISDNTNLQAAWEDFCACGAGMCVCLEINTWIGGSGVWDNAGNWSLGHLPRACEQAVINAPGQTVTVPQGLKPVVYLLDVEAGELILNPGSEISVLGEGFFEHTSCH